MYALIIADTVRELFADAPVLNPDLQIVDVSAVSGIAVGWTTTDSGKTFAAPVVVAPVFVPRTIFAPRDFIGLFAPAEQVALLTSDVAQIRVFVAIALAGNVDITNAEVITDINALVPAGLITADRAKQILAGQAPTSTTQAASP